MRCFVWLKAPLFKAIPSSIWEMTMFMVLVPSWWMNGVGTKQISLYTRKQQSWWNRGGPIRWSIRWHMMQAHWYINPIGCHVSDPGIRHTGENKCKGMLLTFKNISNFKSNMFITEFGKYRKAKIRKFTHDLSSQKSILLSPCYICSHYSPCI